MVLGHLMRDHKNDSTPARIAKDPPKPLVYEALATLNRHFEQVLWDLEQLRALGLFPDRLQRKFLKACRATLEETRAWANFELVEILHQREERDWFRFGRLRQQGEKAWEDPGERVRPAEPRLRKSRKGPRK